MARLPKNKSISLAIQAQNLEKMFGSRSTKIKKNKLIWYGRLTPSPLSECYDVKLTYKLKDRPRLVVISPKLERLEGERADHMYSNTEPCLYDPQKGEWNSSMLLANTIIPWTAEWLLHYEFWLATGTWSGGGRHPIQRKHRRKTANLYASRFQVANELKL